MKRLLAVLMLFGVQAAVTGESGLNYVTERSPWEPDRLSR